MANKDHLAILKQGAEAWNHWRGEVKGTRDIRISGSLESWLGFEHSEGKRLRRADLSNARLYGVDLNDVNLSYANLRKADLGDKMLRSAYLIGANLRGANLCNANLRFAKLSGAKLASADLGLADLTAADLRNADLGQSRLLGTDLRAADLSGADFTRAIIGRTVFTNCDLSDVSGLETVRHSYPSSIGIDTIYRSEGKIPEAFLQGCGVPGNFIRFIPSLVKSEGGIRFYSCFISYSSSDEEFAKRLYGRMREANLRVWFAPDQIKGGEKLHEQIEGAIRLYDKLVLVLSKASMRSAWVMDELRKAFRIESQSGKQKLFPIRLTDYRALETWECRDSISGQDLAEEIRQYFIPDFSRWKDHDSFEAAFQQLLKALRSEKNPRPDAD